MTPAEQARRWDAENELQKIAVVDRKVMIPMRDGIRLATDIYRPKNATGKVPAIWVKTPYNFNFWDVRNGVPSDMTQALTAVKRGYAYIVQNERGHFFSEGNYDILGAPRTDGYDMLDWVAEADVVQRQGGHDGVFVHGGVPDGRCRARAPCVRGDERAGLRRRAWAASGRTTSRVTGIAAGPCRCCSSRGSTANRTRCGPMFPRETSQEDLIRASKSFDLAQQQPPVDWSKALWHAARPGHLQGRRRAARHLR